MLSGRPARDNRRDNDADQGDRVHAHYRISAVAATLLLVTSACSGSGTTLPSASPASAAGAERTRFKGKARIRIAIPRRRHRHRGERYVSAATQSIAIGVTPSGGEVHTYNVGLTPSTNPNCTASLISPLICTVTLTLDPGTYKASFATYDGPLNGLGEPTGNELSAKIAVPLAIAASNDNEVDVTLDGLPASVAILPATTSVLSGNMASGFGVSKCMAAQQVSVVGVDADNNYIVGPGAPVITLASNDTAHLAVTAPAPASPNTFTLSRPSIPSARSTVQLTATAAAPAADGGTPESARVNVTFNGDICGTFSQYSAGAGSEPASITAGPDGAMWFTEELGNKIGRITTSGTITTTTVPTMGSSPNQIALGPDGNLWFTEYCAGKIGRITPTAPPAIADYATSASNSNPDGIVAGPDGAMWFTECGTNNIGRISTGASPAILNEFPSVGVYPSIIAVGSDNNLWYGAISGIDRSTLGFSVSTFLEPTAGGTVQGITAGPDGALWFTEFNNANIGRSSTIGPPMQEFPVPPGSEPYVIVSGPDGALWFTQFSDGRIGRMTTTGGLTEYTGPDSSDSNSGIAVAPDGSIWYTNISTNTITRLQ
jgi:virginiamycin B lyase